VSRDEEPYLQHVIQGAFQDVWIRENIKKKKAEEKSSRVFEATPTRASNGHAQGASRRLKVQTQRFELYANFDSIV